MKIITRVLKNIARVLKNIARDMKNITWYGELSARYCSGDYRTEELLANYLKFHYYNVIVFRSSRLVNVYPLSDTVRFWYMDNKGGPVQ